MVYKMKIFIPLFYILIILMPILTSPSLKAATAESVLYEGYAVSNQDRFERFMFSSKQHLWKATSISIPQHENDTETRKIQHILRQQSPAKRVYLPNPEKWEEIQKWQTKINENHPYYRPFLIESSDNSELLALVELHTMPRAVSQPDPDKENPQDKILNFYQGKGLMTYDPSHNMEKYYGKYRPFNDGKSSMARMRFMPTESLSDDMDRMTDMVKGTAVFIRKLFDLGYPMHPYHSTDPIQGLPKIVMSYTALEDAVRMAYKNASFSVEESEIFKEYWAPEFFDQLPSPKVVTSIFINTIDSQLMDFNIR